MYPFFYRARYRSEKKRFLEVKVTSTVPVPSSFIAVLYFYLFFNIKGEPRPWTSFVDGDRKIVVPSYVPCQLD